MYTQDVFHSMLQNREHGVDLQHRGLAVQGVAVVA